MANYIEFKVRPVLRYFGGKSLLARQIIELIPDSDTFVEPFAGGLNVLLNKCKCVKEIAGDLNTELIHLYITVRDQSDVFLDRLKDIPYTEEIFNRALTAGILTDPVDRALNFLVKYRMSMSGMGCNFSKLNEEYTHDRTGWGSLFDDLKFTAHRIHEVEFYNRSALELMGLYDDSGTSWYMDPPYYPSTRTNTSVYEYEMSHMEHLLLLKRIQKLKGNVIISGYDNPVYNKELKGWDRYEFKTTTNSAQTKVKSQRVEVVWVKCRGF